LAGGAPTAPVSITGTNPASVPLTVTGAAGVVAHQGVSVPRDWG